MVNSQMKQDSILAQKNFTFAAFFMPFYLAFPNNCVNTHTHTQERDQYKGTRDAREYTTNFLLNKECARNFPNNFLCTFLCL